MGPLVPDAEHIFGAFLRSHSAVTALVGQRSAEALSGTYPAIRYSLLPGDGDDTERGDRPELQFECYADDRPTARLIARTVRAALPDIAGTTPIPGAFVVGATLTLSPFYSADPSTGRARYLGQAQLITYAVEAL
jgi:hypothetical protein